MQLLCSFVFGLVGLACFAVDNRLVRAVCESVHVCDVVSMCLTECVRGPTDPPASDQFFFFLYQFGSVPHTSVPCRGAMANAVLPRGCVRCVRPRMCVWLDRVQTGSSGLLVRCFVCRKPVGVGNQTEHCSFSVTNPPTPFRLFPLMHHTYGAKAFHVSTRSNM